MKVEHLGKTSKVVEERKARKRKKNAQSIAEIAVAARKAGMSYGQYVGKYGL